MFEQQGDTAGVRGWLRAAILAGALFWLLPKPAEAGGLEPSGPGFISVAAAETAKAEGDSGRVAVTVLDAEGQDVTAAVKRQGDLRWMLERDGKPADGAGSLRPGAYVLRLGYGDSELRSPVNVAPGAVTAVTIRPGVIRVVPRQSTTARLIFTAAPDNVSAELFAKRGCRVVGPNVAMIRKFPAAGPGGEIYLPPGLYRLITENDRHTMNTTWVRLRAGRAVSLLLDEAGAHPTHAARAPVFAGKCYF